MLSKMVFEVPAQFAARFATGEIMRYGTILKDIGTGQIVGHLQETGIAQSVVSSLVSSLPTPVSLLSGVVNAGSGIYTAVQVRQLSLMMSTLQALQVASLGVSLVGVAVSVAGFAYMRQRFNALDSQLDQFTRTLHVNFEDQRKAALRAQMSRTKGLVQRAQQASALGAPQSEYADVAAALADQAAFFEGEVAFMLDTQAPVHAGLFWQLSQMLMLCNSVRLDCRIRTNELRHALVTAESIASGYQSLFEPLTPLSFDGTVQEGMATIKVLRDASDSAASKPYLIDYLRTRQLRSEDYVSALDQEQDHPFLMLKTA